MKKVAFIITLLFMLTGIGIFLIHHYGPVLGAQFGKSIYIFPPTTTKYGKDALGIIENNGYYANDEEWEKVKEKALTDIKNTKSYKEVHSIIEAALEQAGGKHSFLRTKEEKEEQSANDTLPAITREGDTLIIQLPSLSDAQQNGKSYADTVLQEVEKNDDMTSVVIDLRENGGGDMGPMISAVSPFLDDGKLLSFSSRNGDSDVTLKDGQSHGGGTPIEPGVSPFKIDIPAAVLTSNETASSGEAVLMAFMGQENTKTFGKPSAGYASANQAFPLYDDAVMNLTMAYNKTIDGEKFYDDPIPPDVETDQPLEEAKEWLNEQM